MLEELAEASSAHNVLRWWIKNTHVQDNGKLGQDRKSEYFTGEKLPLWQSTAAFLSQRCSGLFQVPQHHKLDQVPHTKNQITAFHAGDGSNNVYLWKKQVEGAAAILSVTGGLQHNSSSKQSHEDLNVVKIYKVEGSRLGHPRIQCILGLHEQKNSQKPNKNKLSIHILFKKIKCPWHRRNSVVRSLLT